MWAMELCFVCPGGRDQHQEVGTFKDHVNRFVNTVDDIVYQTMSNEWEKKVFFCGSCNRSQGVSR